MSSGIFTRKARKLIFRDNIQQSSINFTRFSIGKTSNRSDNKSLLLVLKKSHNLVLSWAIVTSRQSNTQANKRRRKEANWKREGGQIKRANKTARVKWGRGNERQMANNVMREIGIVMGTWYVDFLHWLPGNGARNPSCYLLSLCWFSPKRKGWCSKVA